MTLEQLPAQLNTSESKSRMVLLNRVLPLGKQQLNLLAAVLCLTSATVATTAGQAQGTSPVFAPKVAMSKWWWNSWLDWCEASPPFIRLKLGDVLLSVPSNYRMSFNLVEGPILSTYETKFSENQSPTTGKWRLHENTICQSPDDDPFVIETLSLYLERGFNTDKFELVGTRPPVTTEQMRGFSVFMLAPWSGRGEDSYVKARPDVNGSVVRRCEGHDVVEYTHKTNVGHKWWQAVFAGQSHTTPRGNPLLTNLATSTTKRPISFAERKCDEHRLRNGDLYKWTDITMLRWKGPPTNSAVKFISNDKQVRRFVCSLQTEKAGPCKKLEKQDEAGEN